MSCQGVAIYHVSELNYSPEATSFEKYLFLLPVKQGRFIKIPLLSGKMTSFEDTTDLFQILYCNGCFFKSHCWSKPPGYKVNSKQNLTKPKPLALLIW